MLQEDGKNSHGGDTCCPGTYVILVDGCIIYTFACERKVICKRSTLIIRYSVTLIIAYVYLSISHQLTSRCGVLLLYPRSRCRCTHVSRELMEVEYTGNAAQVGTAPECCCSCYLPTHDARLSTDNNRKQHIKRPRLCREVETCSHQPVVASLEMVTHHITSHGVDGRRPEGLYIQKIHFNTFIYTLMQIYNTAVSGANEISFVVVNHFLV